MAVEEQKVGSRKPRRGSERASRRPSLKSGSEGGGSKCLVIRKHDSQNWGSTSHGREHKGEAEKFGKRMIFERCCHASETLTLLRVLTAAYLRTGLGELQKS